MSNPSPFGNNNANNSSQGFGQSGGNTSGQGGSTYLGKKKAPCKFFAQGKCNMGDRCNFSHELPGTQQNQGSSSVFGGGGFGQSSNTVGFGSTPFGSAPPNSGFGGAFGGPRR